MNINDVLTPEVVSVVVMGAIVPTIVWAVKKGRDVIDSAIDKAIASKAEGDKYKKYVELAENAIEASVGAVGQTIVDGLKKSGTFDQASKEEVFAEAKQRAVTIMGESAKLALSELYGDFDMWIDSKIESTVKKTK